MAKIKQGILGGFSGSVANVVGSSWKGIAVMKAKPLSVANPQTVKQVAQRTKFKAGQELATGMLADIIRPYWNPLYQKMSGFNGFMSENVAHFSDNGVPNLNTIKTTLGSLEPMVLIDAVLIPEAKEVSVSWDPSKIPSDGTEEDEIFAIIVQKDNQIAGRNVELTTVFKNGFIKIPVHDPPFDQLQDPNVYVTRKRPGRMEVSDSSNLAITS